MDYIGLISTFMFFRLAIINARVQLCSSRLSYYAITELRPRAHTDRAMGWQRKGKVNLFSADEPSCRTNQTEFTTTLAY